DLPGHERIRDVDKTQALRKPGKRDHCAAQTLRWLMAPAHRRLWAAVEIESGPLKGRNRHRLLLDGDVVNPAEGGSRRPQLRPFSSCGIGKQVCVGCGKAGLVLVCETTFGCDMSEMSRMKSPWCQ